MTRPKKEKKKDRPRRPEQTKRPIEAKQPPARTKKPEGRKKPSKGPLHVIAMTVAIILVEMLRGASW